MQFACVVNVLCVCEIGYQRCYIILLCAISLSVNSEQRATKMDTRTITDYEEEEEEDPYQTDDDTDLNYSLPETQRKKRKVDMIQKIGIPQHCSYGSVRCGLTVFIRRRGCIRFGR